MNENENRLPEACGHASKRGSWPRTTSNGPHTVTLQQRDGGEESARVAVVSCRGHLLKAQPRRSFDELSDRPVSAATTCGVYKPDYSVMRRMRAIFQARADE
jgi:hypothetical protein